MTLNRPCAPAGLDPALTQPHNKKHTSWLAEPLLFCFSGTSFLLVVVVGRVGWGRVLGGFDLASSPPAPLRASASTCVVMGERAKLRIRNLSYDVANPEA